MRAAKRAKRDSAKGTQTEKYCRKVGVGRIDTAAREAVTNSGRQATLRSTMAHSRIRQNMRFCRLCPKYARLKPTSFSATSSFWEKPPISPSEERM